jgi:hypothetical protein
MSQIREILTGWGNLALDKLGKLDESTQQLAARRMLKCDGCHMRNNNTCDPTRTGTHIHTLQEHKGCGCNLSAKTLSPDSECPLGKW